MRSGRPRAPDGAYGEPGLPLPDLRRRVVLLLLAASLLPLTILGVGAWLVFGRIVADKSRENLRTIVRDHASSVDLYLAERLAALSTVAGLITFDDFSGPDTIGDVFLVLDAVYSSSFVDLGIIDDRGRHVAYVGPYDLLGRNYRESPWFARAIDEGQYISDVFLGYRGTPHFIIAVRRDEGPRSWILRATVSSEVFERLVRQGRRGRTGDCFIIDREGRYQTEPLGEGARLGPSFVPVEPWPEDLEVLRTRNGGGRELVRTLKPIKGGDWILVAQQEEAELSAPVRHAMELGLLVFGAGVVVIGVTAFFSTRFLVALVGRALHRAEESQVRFLKAGKLASLGEMATGLAHEINNPLAIISAEQTNIGDLLRDPGTPEAAAEMLESVRRSKRQIERCKAITGKMLQFGRQGPGASGWIDPREQLAEIVGLLAPQAAVNDVDLCLQVAEDVPRLHVDPGELQQVVTNLVNNAVQAMPRGGHVLLSAWMEDDGFHLAVEDSGPGVPPPLRERVFEPFFSTKAVGRGTGLGLSVCFGIVATWRGTIRVEGEEGGGAEFHVRLPVEGRESGHGPAPNRERDHG